MQGNDNQKEWDLYHDQMKAEEELQKAAALKAATESGTCGDPFFTNSEQLKEVMPNHMGRHPSFGWFDQVEAHAVAQFGLDRLHPDDSFMCREDCNEFFLVVENPTPEQLPHLTQRSMKQFRKAAVMKWGRVVNVKTQYGSVRVEKGWVRRAVSFLSDEALPSPFKHDFRDFFRPLASTHFSPSVAE